MCRWLKTADDCKQYGVFLLGQRLIIGCLKDSNPHGYCVVFTFMGDKIISVREGVQDRLACMFHARMTDQHTVDYSSKFQFLT